MQIARRTIYINNFILAFKPTTGNQVATIPTLEKTWKVTVDITINGQNNQKWGSIFHFTTGGNTGVYGYRTPGVFQKMKGRIVSVSSAVNGNYDFQTYTQSLAMGVPTTLVITQAYSNGNYHFTINTKGYQNRNAVNNQPQAFNNVKVYISDPWFPPFRGVIRDLILTNNY